MRKEFTMKRENRLVDDLSRTLNIVVFSIDQSSLGAPGAEVGSCAFDQKIWRKTLCWKIGERP